uniref:RNA binding motif protein 41 n=1 Tax=Coturnix japonica TaxID=93934 RepID=A0A8C2TGI2_COTJA
PSRVSSSVCSDEVLLEELETEGERQLKSLLQQQLDTNASIERCKSKRRCFAPAAFYRPFGEAAAGALSLSQFRELQESDRETAALRDLGLSDPEIELWRNRAAGKRSGLGAAPEAVRERLDAIQQKMDERQRILQLPQRFAGSKQLSRREMEIENALFQGTDRHSFLRALYHQAPSWHSEAVEGAVPPAKQQIRLKKHWEFSNPAPRSAAQPHTAPHGPKLTKTPVSLSSIQCFGAATRFRCFFGPRACEDGTR